MTMTRMIRGRLIKKELREQFPETHFMVSTLRGNPDTIFVRWDDGISGQHVKRILQGLVFIGPAEYDLCRGEVMISLASTS